MGKQGVKVTRNEIYNVIKLNNEKNKIKDISGKTGLSDTTIRNIIGKHERGGYDKGLRNAEPHAVQRNGKVEIFVPLLEQMKPYMPNTD
jgi:transposase